MEEVKRFVLELMEGQNSRSMEEVKRFVLEFRRSTASDVG
jgi:hypothetical protein